MDDHETDRLRARIKTLEEHFERLDRLDQYTIQKLSKENERLTLAANSSMLITNELLQDIRDFLIEGREQQPNKAMRLLAEFDVQTKGVFQS